MPRKRTFFGREKLYPRVKKGARGQYWASIIDGDGKTVFQQSPPGHESEAEATRAIDRLRGAKIV